MKPAILASLRGRKEAAAKLEPPLEVPSLAGIDNGVVLHLQSRRDEGKGKVSVGVLGTVKSTIPLDAIPQGSCVKPHFTPQKTECPECGNTGLTDIDGRRFCDGCGKYI